MIKCSHALRILCATPMLLAATVFAADKPAINVVDPYIRQAPTGARVTAAFMVLRNTGKSDLRLVAVDNDAASTTELHQHTNDGGVMKMRQVKDIAIPAGGETALKPGGFHVMLIDLKAPLKAGDTVPASLRFADGSALAVTFPVRGIGASPAAEMHKH